MAGRAFTALGAKNNLKILMVKITKLILVACLSFSLFSCIKSGESRTESYVVGTSDIPLYSGLREVDGESTNFDTISGNIAISTYDGELSIDEVKGFYLTTLPQLGWKLYISENDNISYNRGKDHLEISFKQKQKELSVKFFISS